MIRNQSFRVDIPTKIRFGAGAVGDLPALVRETGASRVFVVIDPVLQGAGVTERITSPLEAGGISYELFEHVEPEPGLRLADEGAAAAKKWKADCVIGVGGGSAQDIAKAVSVLVTNGGKAQDYLGLGKIKKAGLPKIMIPTTAGTGSEVTFTAVFINENTGSKGGMNGNPLYPELALLDPELTLPLPPHVTAATGIDALTHALESYVSVQSHVISDMHGMEAIRLIAANIGKAYANGANLEARSAMLLGSLLAGKGLAMAGVGLVHAMAYPLGGMFNIPHGLANAVLLPYVTEYNIMGNPEKYRSAAELLGWDTYGMGLREASFLAVDALHSLNGDVGIPASLADLDIPEQKIPEMAEVALTVTRPVENNPRRPTLSDVIRIYESAFGE